ncbi:nose resistant to fluoxetine protein 6-like [Penaeus japonicus]|uniref:nose resistant to fluoxetine protein 6-like n=1 Tax=Penaeus japonicus TaxID=27405 RepID=UPI001C70B129|nr:nose resistant to fluoxetine protein 6-like [Penaeus japonicus]XP_042889061.1 nose resistant to fluoxetine protein 6-like [Penaeus japonicus]
MARCWVHVIAVCVLVNTLADFSECVPALHEGKKVGVHELMKAVPLSAGLDRPYAPTRPDFNPLPTKHSNAQQKQHVESHKGNLVMQEGDPDLSKSPNEEDPMEELAYLHALLASQVENARTSKENGFGLPLPLPEMKEEYTRRSFLNLVPLYLPDPVRANPECRRDLQALYRSLIALEELVKNGTLWPMQMVDSWGKFADGMLVGNLNLMGFFGECVRISVTQDDADFRGQYCYLNYGAAKNTSNVTDEWQEIRMPLVSTRLPNSLLIAYATCMPSTCTSDELADTVNEALAPAGYELKMTQCQVEHPQHALSSEEIFGIVFFSVLAAVLVAATILDVWDQYFNHQRLQTGPAKYLLVFSVSHNLEKLFHLDTTKNPGTISCIHGIRFLSICWVVLGHQYVYSVQLASNPSELFELTKPAAFQMIANGDLSVDTFFLLSGTLVCLSLMREMSRTGRFNPALYYLHRIIRLLPPIAMADAFLATVSGLLVTGPLAGIYRSFYLKGCRHSWWMDVTFISNLLFPYLEDMGKTNEGATCLPHCWYTGVDTQLYILVPLVLLPLYYRKKQGRLWLSFWTLASLVVPGAIIGAYDLWPTSMISTDTEASLQYNYKVYLTPWCRAGPYLVGLWAGYILHTAKNSPQYSKLSARQVWAGWAAATGVALAVVFGIARYNNPSPGTPQMSLTEAVLYGGLHRAAWAVAVAWIILACHWGYGGPVDWFLSHPCWQPLSRLTYCIYLSSLPIQFALQYSTVRPHYYTNLAKIQETCGVLFIVILVSIALTLVSESPILRLEKLILRPSTPKIQEETTMRPDDLPSVSTSTDTDECSENGRSETGSHGDQVPCTSDSSMREQS